MDTVSASDQEILPPGGFSLRYGFPAWFPSLSSSQSESSKTYSAYQILEYIRHAFNDEDFLDSIPLNSVANPGAYHAWHTFRTRKLQSRALSPQPGASSKRNSGTESASGSSAERAQGGHRKQWNWDGVWEERVKRGIQSSLSHQSLFGNAAAADDMIRFSNISSEDFELIMEQIRSKAS